MLPIETILLGIRDILSGDFDVPEQDITETAHVRGDLGLDSLDVVDLVYFVQDRFHYKAELHDYRDLETVAQLAQFIQQKTRSAA